MFASKACKAVPDSVRDKFRAIRKELEQKKIRRSKIKNSKGKLKGMKLFIRRSYGRQRC